MAKRSRKRQSSIAIPTETVEKIARQFVTTHDFWIEQGLKLTNACRLYRCNDGTWTGRFVYRATAAQTGQAVTLSSVHTVRGIRIA